MKTKERETGIEPATSSLGNWVSIESKDQSRVSASTISIKNRCSFHLPNSSAAEWAANGLHDHDANPITWYIQKLQSRRLAVVITEQATEPFPASYRSRCVADHLVGCDDPIAETLMISFKVVMRTEMLK